MAYHILFVAIKLFACIPFRFLYAISDAMFYITYYVVRYRRALVRKNLSSSFPGKSKNEIIDIEKKFYHYLTDQILETIKLSSISPEELRKRMKFTNIEEVNTGQRAGKSVSLFLGHYGNWEWVSSLPLWLENHVVGAQIYRTLRNESINRLMLRIRNRMGAENVEMRQTARYIREQNTKKNICFIGFIADQSPQKKDATHFIPFLNHNTPVVVGTEKLTKRYDFDAWFLNIKRLKRGYYEGTFIKMHDNPKDLPDYELTAIYYQLLEKMINACPEIYLWSHNRFKHATGINA